jgi:hypothetical protein
MSIQSILKNAVWSRVPDSVKNYGPTLAQGAVILVTIHQIATKGILAPPVFLTPAAIPIGVGCMVVAPFLCTALRGLAKAKDFSDDFGFESIEEEGSTEEPVQNKEPSSTEKALDIGKALWEVTWRGCLVHGLIQRGLIVIASSMTPKAAAAFFNTGLSYGAIGSITGIATASAWKTHRQHVSFIGPYQSKVELVTAFALTVFYGVLAAKGGLTSAIAAHATHKVVYRLFQKTIQNCFTSAKEWYATKLV